MSGRNGPVVCRRGFISSAVGAAAYAAMPSWAGNIAVPGYYSKYLDSVAGKIASKAKSATDGFFFITDLHVNCNFKKSGGLIASLSGSAPVRKVLCGGDLPGAYTESFPNDRVPLDYAVDWYRKGWVDPIESAGVDVYTARGNHDFSIRRSAKSEEGCTIPAAETRSIIMGTKAVARDAVDDPANPDAICYYFDNAASKVRYIVADSTDSTIPGRRYWILRYGMHAAQLEWLAGTAFATVPPGWSIVVMQHIPVVGCITTTAEAKIFDAFRELMEAYQNRKVWCSASGRNFDFGGAGGRIMLDITGHVHCERQAFLNGILHVTEPCDACYKDYIYHSPLCGNLPIKAVGTIYEHTFDAVQVDASRGLVHFTRIGGGQDRVIHTDAARMSVGDVKRFKAEHLHGPLTWVVYDGDESVSVRREDENGRQVSFTEYKTTFAAVDSAGCVKALRPGTAMVVALDSALNKEIFPLSIG